MILGVIPARYASSRFPGKPLAAIKGKSMIQRVYEQCQKAEHLHDIVVATDDERIFSHVVQFGGNVEMTADTHQSGTERVSEIAQIHPQYSHYINIQGDEPFIDPAQINLVAEALQTEGTDIATVVKPLKELEHLTSSGHVKVVIDHLGHALYFSRSPIPHVRGQEPETWLSHADYYLHVGIYGFKREILLRIPHMTPSALEKAESLEQLRWLANGCRIRTAITEQTSIAIDTPDDLQQLLENM